MFDGVSDQFHQFIASSNSSPSSSSAAAARAAAIALPLSFPHHHHHLHNLVSSSNGFTSFVVDPNLYTSNSHHHQILPPHLQHLQQHFLHPFEQHQTSCNLQKNEEKELVGMNMEEEMIGRDERSMGDDIDDDHIIPWSNDEVLALLRIRSSFENWFSQFTWEHVSRRLAELGFKRSAEKCKEKFEEESRYYNNTKNYRLFTELEELCQGENPLPLPPPPPNHHHSQQVVAADNNYEINNKNLENNSREEEEENNMGQNNFEDTSAADGNNDNAILDHHQDNENVVENNNDTYNNMKKRKRSVLQRRRRRQKMKFEMLKGFFEDIVNKLMAQQEEVHNKLIQDMVKRDEEEIAKEEAWKKQELDRINQELELRVKEQAVAGDRLAAMIKFLTKFSSKKQQRFEVERNTEDDLASMVAENPNPKTPHQADPQNPNSVVSVQTNPLTSPPSIVTKAPKKPTSNVDNTEDKPPGPSLHSNRTESGYCTEDIGKRWPRDEVLALINLRCGLNNYNNGGGGSGSGSGGGGGDHDNKEGGGGAMKGPLWERISQGMLELGYKRSAKRCKEKWENINKYFRKTKDANKKRSLDSRTCPYFHQLSTLYNQGTVLAPSGGFPEADTDSSQREAN